MTQQCNDTLSRYRDVLKILKSQHVTLAQAGAPKELLDTYRTIVRHLSRMSNEEVRRVLNLGSLKHHEKQAQLPLPLSDATKLSLEQIEHLVADESTPRKTLEAIAIGRFQVPRGSMRSFASIGTLKEKITTLVQNERAHHTISSMAQHPRN